ncbi:hypothetical protein B0H34DRAFT_658479, partial [Crassisporium funariophilum]
TTPFLPYLGIVPSKPLCKQTARHWLVKLCWTRTIIQKGVYLDGHELPNIIDFFFLCQVLCPAGRSPMIDFTFRALLLFWPCQVPPCLPSCPLHPQRRTQCTFPLPGSDKGTPRHLAPAVPGLVMFVV